MVNFVLALAEKSYTDTLQAKDNKPVETIGCQCLASVEHGQLFFRTCACASIKLFWKCFSWNWHPANAI